MRRPIAIAAALAALAAAPAAPAASGGLSYQGWTSQGEQIGFRVTKQGASRMRFTVITKCSNGDTVSFALKALDTRADPVRRGRFTAVLDSAGAPKATVKGKLGPYFTGRGTITASGKGRGPNGEHLGTCRTERPVRWTAGP